MIDSGVDAVEQEDNVQDRITSRARPRLFALLADGVGNLERVRRIVGQSCEGRFIRLGVALVKVFHVRALRKPEKYDPTLFALIDEMFKKSKFRYVRYDKRHPAEKKAK